MAVEKRCRMEALQHITYTGRVRLTAVVASDTSNGALILDAADKQRVMDAQISFESHITATDRMPAY